MTHTSEVILVPFEQVSKGLSVTQSAQQQSFWAGPVVLIMEGGSSGSPEGVHQSGGIVAASEPRGPAQGCGAAVDGGVGGKCWGGGHWRVDK